jgi:catechol 2,3-dioxygenase-like lactoylglutathione lyase family enzyme
MTADAADSPRLDQINLVVRDMDAMAAFYARLGVNVLTGPPAWQPHHRNAEADGDIHIDFDSTTFASTWNRGWDADRRGAILVFRMPTREAVDRYFDTLTAAGYRADQEPYDAFWGARFAAVADPDGNSVGLMSAIDPSRRTRPPDPPA